MRWDIALVGTEFSTKTSKLLKLIYFYQAPQKLGLKIKENIKDNAAVAMEPLRNKL